MCLVIVIIIIFRGERSKNKDTRAVMNISTAIKITYLAQEHHRFCTFNEYVPE
jgi:hypothetical protein